MKTVIVGHITLYNLHDFIMTVRHLQGHILLRSISYIAIGWLLL